MSIKNKSTPPRHHQLYRKLYNAPPPPPVVYAKKEQFVIFLLTSSWKKIVCRSFDNHLTSHNVLSSRQWCFREGHSTEILLHLTAVWTEALDDGLKLVVLFIYFMKALYCVDHIRRETQGNRSFRRYVEMVDGLFHHYKSINTN